jgi:hypothetical protein
VSLAGSTEDAAIRDTDWSRTDRRRLIEASGGSRAVDGSR